MGRRDVDLLTRCGPRDAILSIELRAVEATPIPFGLGKAIAADGRGGRAVRPNRHVAAVQVSDCPVRHAAMDHDPVFRITLGKDFAISCQPGQQPAIGHPGLDIDIEEIVTQRLTDLGTQLIQADSCPRTDRQCVRIASADLSQLASVGGIDLVEHQQRIFGLDAQLFQHFVDGTDLIDAWGLLTSATCSNKSAWRDSSSVALKLAIRL